jgi:peptidoglycan/LPS O-acetylase OafA/YrhL
VYPRWNLTWGLAYVDMLSACLIVMALDSSSVVFHIFNVRPLRWLGRISYGAYVFHDILHPEIGQIVALCKIHQARTATAVLGLASTLLISWASFRWFESPFIRLKKRWTRPSLRMAPQTPNSEPLPAAGSAAS